MIENSPVQVREGGLAPEAQRSIAARFVAARLQARSLAEYPGPLPRSAADAYAIQELALGLWPETPAGWKVALTPPAQRAAFGAERLAGPVFPARLLRAREGREATIEAFAGGFAAIEAEFVFVMAKDAPRFGRAPSLQEAAALTGALHIGLENAGSPLATLNDLGPLAVASDFGNNNGVVLGAAIADWPHRPPETMTAIMRIDGAAVGEGHAGRIPGGPLAALAFLIAHLEERGRPLRAGQIVSTGATTGIHAVSAGARFEADFGPLGAIRGRVAPMPHAPP